MKAGFGRCELTFPKGFFPTEGFTEQVDALHARVLLLESKQRVAVLSLEMTSLPSDAVAPLKDALVRACAADECFVCATHTFSAPHLMPDQALRTEADRQKKEALLALLVSAAKQAATQAAERLCEAQAALGQTECKVNAARDVETPAGWWVDTNGTGAVDHRLTALRFEDLHGKLLGALLHYSVQSSVLDGSVLASDGKAVSGDLAGEISRGLEARHPDSVALFLIGAAGDQAPRDKAIRVQADESGALHATDKQDAALALLRSLGEEAAEAAEAALQAAKPIANKPLSVVRMDVTVPAKRMERDLHALHPTRVPPYEADGESVQTPELLTIGGLRILCVKPELNCCTAASITHASGADTLVATMVNGGAKYMAEQAAYDRITYEAMNSPFGRGAAERLAQAARTLLAQAPNMD